MRVLVITACTGQKAVTDERALTLDDFRLGKDHVVKREQELEALLTPAEKLYTGQQHVRLMRGVEAWRKHHPTNGGTAPLELYVLSAGYGVVSGTQPLAPYEVTFQGMKAKELRQWADTLEVPTDIRRVLAKPYDLGLVLLGDSYLKACALDESIELGGPTILFCGEGVRAKLPRLTNLRAVVLSNQDAKRFSCGLVALKGEIATQLLEVVTSEPSLVTRLLDPATDLLGLLVDQNATPKRKRKGPIANPRVDRVISIPKSWWDKPHRAKLRYFIPEWDDLVDPDYDFENDVHSGGSGDWSNQVYAHQMYEEPNYDGILVSKVTAEQGKKKRERINEFGVHRFLRVPRTFPVMGDCGAFGYIKEQTPPYETTEILDYYSRLDFDYGVSIDHLIVTATAADSKFRYDLTMHNAEEFLREHLARGLTWTPIGAVQGWDAPSYAQAAKQYSKMGYKHIGLGGLVRTSTAKLLPILQAVRDATPDGLNIHLFGVARLDALADFIRFGINSVDSASYLRQAWMSTKTSYVLPDASYTALRIPEAGKSYRAKRMKEHAELSDDRILSMERDALRGVREYAKGEASMDAALTALMEYDQHVTTDRVDMEPLYRRTLEERPWERCDCAVCRDSGVEVVIFRGNNRNRRRGFHNTRVFYELFAETVMSADEARLSPTQSELPFGLVSGGAA